MLWEGSLSFGLLNFVFCIRQNLSWKSQYLWSLLHLPEPNFIALQIIGACESREFCAYVAGNFSLCACILYATRQSTLTQLSQKFGVCCPWGRMFFVTTEFDSKQSHEIWPCTFALIPELGWVGHRSSTLASHSRRLYKMYRHNPQAHLFLSHQLEILGPNKKGNVIKISSIWFLSLQFCNLCKFCIKKKVTDTPRGKFW